MNPRATEILGHQVYPDVASLPEVPDVVDVFRKPSDLQSVMDDALAVGARTVWAQLGVWNEEADRAWKLLRTATPWIMDLCSFIVFWSIFLGGEAIRTVA